MALHICVRAATPHRTLQLHCSLAAMRAPAPLASLALLLSLLVLALAHAVLGQVVLLPSKTIYERGDNDMQWQTSKSRHYYLEDGQCTGVIEGKNIPCPATRLRVATTEDLLPPSLYITDQLDYVYIRRQPDRIIKPAYCPERLYVYLNISCKPL